jgi:hypothetical protein
MDIHCKFDELVSLKEIKPKLNPKNRNAHPDAQIDAIIDQFKYQGIRHPIIISTRSNLVVAGEGRFLAAEKMGLKEFPVSRQNFVDEAQEYAFGIADNAISAWAELDLKSINSDLIGLPSDFDLDLLGIENFELENKKEEKEEENVDLEQLVKQPRCRTGDLFMLGSHRLLCGDSTNCLDVERLMNGEKADMVFTDGK